MNTTQTYGVEIQIFRGWKCVRAHLTNEAQAFAVAYEILAEQKRVAPKYREHVSVVTYTDKDSLVHDRKLVAS